MVRFAQKQLWCVAPDKNLFTSPTGRIHLFTYSPHSNVLFLKKFLYRMSFLFTTRPHFEQARVCPVLSIGIKTCSQVAEFSIWSVGICESGSRAVFLSCSSNIFIILSFLKYFTKSSIKYILQNETLRE